MKLQRLYLGDYRVLRDLEIRFGPPVENSIPLTHAPSYSLDFLVGVNGTGKSTVLRVLFDLMRKLERQAPIDYPFEMEYELGKDNHRRIVKFSNRYEDPETEEIRFTKTPNVWEVDRDGQRRSVQLSLALLPEMVVTFTTGSEAALNNLDEKQDSGSSNLEAIENLAHIERSIRELPGKPPSLSVLENSKSEEESKFLLIQSQHIPLVTLCGLLTDLAEPPQNRRLLRVLKEAKIGTMAGFSLKFRKTQLTADRGYWDEVVRLAKLATRALRLGTDYLLVFDLTQRENPIAQQIIEEFSSGLYLFKILARLAKVSEEGQSVLREVSIFLERSSSSEHPEAEKEKPPLHLLEWLSDGERSFLGRMCLFTLLGSTEALILLDEPEVHFNDFWKRQIVQLLDETLKERHSHVLITTHSSITLTDVRKEDIIVLDRNGNYTRDSDNPRLRTFGADPSDILVHVFGAPHPAGASSVHRIEQELDNSLNRSPSERREVLEELLDKVVAQGYWSYLIRRELQLMEQ
ncbi:AAA family ATPase [Microcoleus sp. ZQ-A2]|nr:AAA family ATPase [Microcoleus sp. FACHB-1]